MWGKDLEEEVPCRVAGWQGIAAVKRWREGAEASEISQVFRTLSRSLQALKNVRVCLYKFLLACIYIIHSYKCVEFRFQIAKSSWAHLLFMCSIYLVPVAPEPIFQALLFCTEGVICPNRAFEVKLQPLEAPSWLAALS